MNVEAGELGGWAVALALFYVFGSQVAVIRKVCRHDRTCLDAKRINISREYPLVLGLFLDSGLGHVHLFLTRVGL